MQMGLSKDKPICIIKLSETNLLLRSCVLTVDDVVDYDSGYSHAE